MITPSKDLGFTKKAFESLPQGDATKDFYNGQVWNAPSNLLEKFLFNFGIESKLSALHKVYPYHKFIGQVSEEFEQ